MKPIDRIVQTREDAHAVALAAYRLAQQVIEDGKPAHIRAELHEPDRTLQQNRYYWGHVLKEVSEQAMTNGQRWAAEAWHELFKRMFIGYRITKVTVAGRRKKQVIRRLRSTKDLTVRQMTEYLERVQAFAVTDLSVRFPVARWEEWRE